MIEPLSPSEAKLINKAANILDYYINAYKIHATEKENLTRQITYYEKVLGVDSVVMELRQEQAANTMSILKQKESDLVASEKEVTRLKRGKWWNKWIFRPLAFCVGAAAGYGIGTIIN